MFRKTHLVGAWPGLSAPHAMETALTRVGPHLSRMTDGETDERSQWAGATIEWMRVNPDVEAKTDRAAEEKKAQKEGKRYVVDGFFQVKEGHKLDPDNIRHPYYAGFHESYPAFKFLREKFDEPQISFQVGLPSPYDCAGIIFGRAITDEDPSYEEAFRRSTLREIEQIRDEAGDDVIFQLECVYSLISILRAPVSEQQAVAERVAAQLHQLVAASPKGTRFGAHLCLGDFNHKAMGEMNDATPVVLLANALVKNFPKQQELEYIHVPFAAADKPGSLEESWYTPLEALDLPDDVGFVAGFIHEDVSPQDNKKLLGIIERFAGRQVDVAASCGLGRRPDPAQAWDAMDKAVALVEG